MNIHQVTLEQYWSYSEEEKIQFYRKILDDTPRSKNTTQYRTAIKLAPQARVPEINFHQPNGKLSFIAPLKRTDKNITSLFFLCLCDCGEWIILEANAFRREKQKNCLKCSQNSGVFIKDISGQIYGQLKALYPSEKRGKDGSVYWVCECIDCGHQQLVLKYNLNKTATGHLCAVCGAKSAGEYMVGKLLQSMQLIFETEKTFLDCKFPNSQQFARFDFFVNNQYIIEIDGEHHYQPCKYGGNITDEKAYQNFLLVQQRDAFKNNYCFEHNIPIIRIPYFYLEKNKLTVQDLNPYTSQFLLTSNLNAEEG